MIISVSTIFGADESLYPSGFNITAQYTSSAGKLAITDTLVITRTIANNESFDIHDLYFSENIPPEFEAVAYSAKIDNIDIEYINIGPVPNHEISIEGKFCFHN